MCNSSDPFGLAPDDHYYDETGREVETVKNDQPDRFFLRTGGETFQLDYGLQEGNSPYLIIRDTSMFDAEARALATQAGPVYGNLASIAVHSLPGGSLDFKRLLPDRSLWNAGGGLMTHKHAVGNAAWGKYMSLRGYAMLTALRGAAMQGASVGGEDPLDQSMIRRGYRIP